MTRIRNRCEAGVTAVVVGVSSLLLLSVAAFAVDLGNAYARKRDVQNQADFSALAAAGSMSNTVSGTPSASDPAVKSAAQYLYDNWPQNDADLPDDGRPPAASIQANLVNGSTADGQACYGTFDAGENCIASPGKFTVLTPRTQVNYGLARVMGPAFSDIDLNATATVAMGSPAGSASMPFYAVHASGCDWGPQKLTDPANGKVQTTVPNFQKPTETNKSTLESLTPTSVPYLPPTQPAITITGKNLASVTKVGFFRDISLTPNFVESPPLINSDTTGKTVPNLRIPAAVTNVEDIWYVRVFGPGNGVAPPQYSKAGEALPLRVGDSLFQCAGASSSGNFGSVYVPRTDVPSTNDMLAKNIAVGPQAPLTLAIYPGGLAAPALCVSGGVSIISKLPSPGLRAGTNCVDTDTGLTANGTTAGLIAGVGSTPGRLIKATSTGCDPNQGSSTRSVSFGSKSYALNNDILTCFFTDDTVSVDTISKSTYSGPAVLSQSIYDSPRFAWVPVVSAKPIKGGSETYSIIDFRAAFITGQTKNATKTGPWTAATATDKSDNGLTITTSGVTSMQVVFFNAAALPALSGGAPVGPYLGVGPKVIQLIN